MKKNENIIAIFISYESLILGDSNNISIAGDILNIFLLIEVNITVIGNLNNFCFSESQSKHFKNVYVLITL